jgi:hypothetical protein
MQKLSQLILNRQLPGTFPIVTKRLAEAVAADLATAIAPEYEVVVGESPDRAFGALIVVQERSALTRPNHLKS